MSTIAHFIKPCRDRSAFVNWILVMFYETDGMYTTSKLNFWVTSPFIYLFCNYLSER